MIFIITLRQTILNDFKICGYKCFKGWGNVGEAGKYDLEESPGNKYSKCGILVHEVMEMAGRSILDEDERPTLDTLLTLTEEKFFALPLDMFDDADDEEKWRVSLLEQVEWLYEQKLKSNNFIDVEWKFTIDNMFNDMPPFTGTMDIIEGNLESKNVSLSDYKTGRKYTKKEVDNNIQACVYSLAFYKQYGFLPKEFTFIFSKTKRKMTVQITFDFINRVSAEIMRIVTEMKNGHFEPSCNNKFFCNNFCEFYDECPKFKRTQKKGWDAVNEYAAI